MPEHRTDPEPEPGRDRLRKAVVRPSRRQVVVAALLAVLGFAFVVQVRDTAANDTYAGLRESELVEVLDGLTGTAERARREVDRLEARRDELANENQARFAALDEAEQRVRTHSCSLVYLRFSGYTGTPRCSGGGCLRRCAAGYWPVPNSACSGRVGSRTLVIWTASRSSTSTVAPS